MAALRVRHPDRVGVHHPVRTWLCQRNGVQRPAMGRSLGLGRLDVHHAGWHGRTGFTIIHFMEVGVMAKLKEKLQSVAKEYARQTGEIIGFKPWYWCGKNISDECCCFSETIFLSLSDMQMLIDHLDKWIERYGSKELVGKEVLDWLEYVVEDAYDKECEQWRRYARINLWSWLSGLRLSDLKWTTADEIHSCREKIATVRSLMKEFRDNRALDNVLQNLEAYMKELKAKQEKETKATLAKLKETDAYKEFINAIDNEKPESY